MNKQYNLNEILFNLIGHHYLFCTNKTSILIFKCEKSYGS